MKKIFVRKLSLGEMGQKSKGLATMKNELSFGIFHLIALDFQ
jgi:hypothetical protein